MNPNDYLGKTYAPPPCWGLVRDVILTELGLTVTDFRTVNNSAREAASAFDIGVRKNADGFAEIDTPVDLCVVLMSKLQGTKIHHAGIYFQGSVLHALDSGVVYQDMASLGDLYRRMEFWTRPAP
ncbi:hypothetical protein BH10PSE18_BH10PSE18_15320 [soil metagenome]